MIVDCALYEDGNRVLGGTGVSVLDDLDAHPDGFVWLGLRMPDIDELTGMCRRLDIDGIDMDEVLSPHTRPVLSVEGDVLNLVVRTARYIDAEESVSLGEMTILVHDRAVVSVRHGQASPLSELREELEQSHDRLRHGPLGVMVAIVARIIADYRPALDGFEKDALEVEREVFAVNRQQPVRRLYALKREVRVLLHAIESLDEPLDRLIRHLSRHADRAVVEDLNEAADQLARTVSRVRSLSGLLDAALTASLAQTGIQQNEDMRKISAWVAMAAVPTMVAGIYGMNFEHMPELDSAWGYPLVFAGMGAIVVFMYRAFKQNDWL
jgi:magnesium transporter